MKRRFLCACLLAGTLALGADDATTVDLFAGWSWSPFRYGRYDPFYYGPSWRGYPYAGLGVPLYPWDRWDRAGYPYPAYGYDPFWEYGYSVHVRLTERPYTDPRSEHLLPPLPGSAPTELLRPEREQLWLRDLEALFGPRSPAPTNAPPTPPF